MTTYKVIYWFEQAIPSRATLEQIDQFDARGKRRVYALGSKLGSQTFQLYIWKHKDGRMFARFWSRCDEVDWESYEIIGLKDNFTSSNFEDRGVPLILRKAYNSWVMNNLAWH